MRHDVPSSVIAIVAEQVANSETHATLDSLFMYVGATGEPPEGSKHAKALAWLRRVNRDESVNPMRVVGKIIEGYMEAVTDQTSGDFAWERKEKIAQILASCELQYVKGGLIGGSLASLSRTLEQLIRDRDFVSINEEFDRALRSVENSPRDAVSAACNIPRVLVQDLHRGRKPRNADETRLKICLVGGSQRSRHRSKSN